MAIRSDNANALWEGHCDGRTALMLNVVLSLLMLAAFALLAGAYFLWRRSGDTKRPLLMVVLAIIAVVNIAIWTVPDSSGEAPVDAAGGSFG